MARQPIWLRPVVEPTTGRPAEWSRAQITEAAVAVADVPAPPDTGDWRADVVGHNIDLLRHLRERPWVVDGVVARPPIGPHSVRRVEQMLAVLAPCPAPGSAKMEAIGVIAGMVQTTAVHERPGRGGALDEEFVAAQMTVMACAAQDGSHPHLAAVFAEPPPDGGETGDERMARILRLVLDGLLPDDG